ncbi:VOC family protein [Qipengyuania marisflavi]|uniref:VOC family protein n=1 Tax=Qipengyuania marisflavi TaxID=2486356 RepID=A0A5S3P722_9SPHN|nr:VOC family protein [Qipengyuania marisflavi]TMM48935.1 VOC family protein [Qipengyuania marisflavi]
MADKIAPCLWFDGNAEEAMRFYAGIFPDSSIDKVNPSPSDWPGGKAGGTITVEATILGAPYLALNGGPDQPFTDAVSFQIYTDDQAETDRYWNALLEGGGEPMACSWLSDRYGVRWQIVPRALMDGLRHEDAEVRSRVFAAMSQMIKIDHDAIEAAIEGAS